MGGTLRYLTADDVRAAMPAVDERLSLADRTMRALVSDAELPPKIGVHPRPEGAFAHAMPALLRPVRADATTADDLLGIKWVTGFGGNRAVGLPAIHATVIVSDPATGVPVAILDGGPITAARTAAVSGVAIRAFGAGRRSRDWGTPRVAIVGAGVQGHSHIEIVAAVLPGAELVIHDRHPERSDALAELADATAGIAAATTVATARAATLGADVVITAASFTTPDRRGTMTGDRLSTDALVIAVDYATMCAAAVAREAALFVVDDRGQFLANRDAGQFDDYPDPGATIGEVLIGGTTPPPSGRVVVTHLGVGLADIVFADAIVRRASELGLGIEIPR